MGRMTFFLLLCVFVVYTRGYYQPPDGRDCKDVIKDGNLSKDFTYSVAHGIHWLTLDDLKLYFNRDANTTNKIPTINQDLVSSIPILDSAPGLNLTTNFTTLGMQVLDRILSHMDNDHYEGTNMDILRRLIHGFHMHEVWYQTSLVYKQIKQSPMVDQDLCPCLTDIEINGIFKRIRLMALEIREPQLIYESGREQRSGRGYHKTKSGKGATYKKSKIYWADSATAESSLQGPVKVFTEGDLGTGGGFPAFDGSLGLSGKRKKRSPEDNNETEMEPEEKDFLEKVLTYADDNDGEGPIDDEKAWREDAKNMMRPMTKMYTDLAIFLYCMLEV